MKTVIVYGMNNNIGGIESYLLNIYKYIKEQVKFVFLVEDIAKGSSFIHEEAIRNLGGEYRFIPEHHQFKEYTRRLQLLLREFKGSANTIYFNVNYIAFDIIPIRIALFENYRVIVHSHNTMLEPIKDIRYRMSAKIRTVIGMARLKSLSVERIAITKEAGKYLFRGRPFDIVSPGVEVNRFVFSKESRDQMRKRYKVQDAIVLGFVGRIMSVKNPLFLLDILKDMKSRNMDVKLLVVGDGIMREELEMKAAQYDIENDMIVVGAVKNPQDYLQAMDVLLAPSFSEGLGLSIIEAQSMGVPCVCAKGNVPVEVNVTGAVYFCDLNLGSKGWVNCIKNVLSKNYDRLEMHNKVDRCQYNIDRSVDKLLRVIA